MVWFSRYTAAVHVCTGATIAQLGMVPFGDRALDPVSTRPQAWDWVHWTQLYRPEQWASDPSEWASDTRVDKLICKKRKHKP